MQATTMCPCCGDDMTAGLVTCWTCYRESDRLTPGTYVTNGETWTLTAEAVARYEAQRVAHA